MVLPVKQSHLLLLLIGGVFGCENTKASGTAAAPSASAAPTVRASASTSSSAPPTARSASPATAVEAPTVVGEWRGPFQAELAKVTLDPGVGDSTWAKDKGTAAVGKGQLELTVASDGQVRGKLSGALGDLVLFGVAEGGLVHGTFSAEQPEPTSMSGTVELTLTGDALGGELRASSGDAKLVRRATLSLKRAK